VRKTFDIVHDINMRYQIIFDRYRRHETSISTTLFMTFDIKILSPSISISVTFNIDIDIRYRRCKTSISNGHSISKSSISNVTLDIKGPTLDIGVARIHMVLPVRRGELRPARAQPAGPGSESDRDRHGHHLEQFHSLSPSGIPPVTPWIYSLMLVYILGM
jgi:hypothetical protein